MMKKYRRRKGKRSRRHSNSLRQNKTCRTSAVGDGVLCVWWPAWNERHCLCNSHQSVTDKSYRTASWQDDSLTVAGEVCVTIWQCWCHFLPITLPHSMVSTQILASYSSVHPSVRQPVRPSDCDAVHCG